MESQQEQSATELSVQTDQFNCLSERLEKWCDLITAGNHDSFADLTNSNEISDILDTVRSSRIAMATIKQNLETLDEHSTRADFIVAFKRLSLANTRLRMQIQRGLLFTQTMLNALTANLTANSIYDDRAHTALPSNNGWRTKA